MKAKPQRVTWTTDEELQCAILASLGFSTAYIAAKTGLSHCQIGYRLGRASIKRKDYRNGESAMAQRVIARVIPNRNSEIRSTLNLRAIITVP